MAPGGVLVVNMIPAALSGETNQDSEPHLAVNPTDPQQIVGTAFTPDPMGGNNAPVYISTDGGNTWTLNTIVPSSAPNSSTHDITTAFSRSSRLYAGILRDPTLNMDVLRSNNFASPNIMDVLEDRSGPDQPFTYAITTAPNPAQDRVYIGNNDLTQPATQTSTVEVVLDAGSANPTINNVRIEARTTVGQDGPQVRPVAHADGTVYAAFYGWRSETGSWPANTLVVTADIVVVRDDNGATGATPFQNLIDSSDGLTGVRVVQGIQFPFHQSGIAAAGQQRLGGDLSVAVDPNNSATVYLAYSDQQQGSLSTLHVLRSTDKGATWSSDLLTIPTAVNGALAANSAGSIGFLYQQFIDEGAGLRWVTHFQRSSDNGANWNDLILADTPANTPVKTFDPYLGDYDHLLALDQNFYGIFAANNTPDNANFPNGVTFQRNADFNTHTLFAVDGVTPVPPSIDPFFFKTTG